MSVTDLEEESAQRAADALELERLRRTMEFGWKVEEFLGSDIGRFLCLQAESERIDLLESLGTMDPTDAAGIRRVQMRIEALGMWQGWLAEAIQTGRQVEQMAIDRA